MDLLYSYTVRKRPPRSGWEGKEKDRYEKAMERELQTRERSTQGSGQGEGKECVSCYLFPRSLTRLHHVMPISIIYISSISCLQHIANLLSITNFNALHLLCHMVTSTFNPPLAWSHMSERVNPSWKQVTDDTSFPFHSLLLTPPLSSLR